MVFLSYENQTTHIITISGFLRMTIVYKLFFGLFGGLIGIAGLLFCFLSQRAFQERFSCLFNKFLKGRTFIPYGNLRCILEVRRSKNQSRIKEKSFQNVSRERSAQTGCVFGHCFAKTTPKGVQEAPWGAEGRPFGTQNGPRDPPKDPQKCPG